jgi:hypothetical protein
MNDEKRLIIKHDIPLNPISISNQPFIALFREKRQEFIHTLGQIPSVLQVIQTLAESKTYRAYISPEILERLKTGTAHFGKRDSGLLSASILDSETNKIIHNASLIESSPDLLSCLNDLTIQQTLAEITSRLEAIDEKITDVLQGQHNDRLAEVESGVHLYEQAIAATDLEIRQGLLISAIEKLTEGRNKLLRSTDIHFVDKLPRSRWGMFFSRHLDIPKYVQEKAHPVREAAHAIVKSSRYLILAYAVLNEPMSLRVSLQQSEGDILAFEEKMREIASWLPPTDFWSSSFLEIADDVIPTSRLLESIEYKAVEIEFMPREMLLLEEGDETTM